MVDISAGADGQCLLIDYSMKRTMSYGRCIGPLTFVDKKLVEYEIGK